MNKRNIILLICLHIAINIVYGQKIKSSEKSYVISGSIKGYKGGTLEMHFMPEGNDRFESKYIATFDSVGLFNLSLPYPKSIGDRIALIARPKNAPVFFVFSSLIEPGDKVKVSIKKLDSNFSITFSGKGSDKYRCTNEIFNTQNSLDEVELKMPDKKFNEPYTIDDTIVGISKTYLAYRETPPFKILEKYKDKLNPIVYKIIHYDIVGMANARSLMDVLNLNTEISKASNAEKFDKVVKLFNTIFNHVEDTTDANFKIFSSTYTGYLFGKAAYGLIIERRTIEISVREVYAKIRENYRGALRDDLIIMTLNSSNKLAPLKAETIDSLWRDSYEVITTQALKDYVASHIKHALKGIDAFKFSLPDVNGNIVKLEDFKGKVVLMDFWFTGCAGCAGYVRSLREYVYPKFKDNPNLVFVSISGDKNKNTWLQSVASGKYTDTNTGFINLYTAGQGFDHPLTKYYGFNGGPHSLLIDKSGKIFHGNPPTLNMDSLVMLIEQALSSPR